MPLTNRPIRTDHESVAREIEHMETFLPLVRRALGQVVEDSVRTLMEFARERVVDAA